MTLYKENGCPYYDSNQSSSTTSLGPLPSPTRRTNVVRTETNEGTTTRPDVLWITLRKGAHRRVVTP